MITLVRAHAGVASRATCRVLSAAHSGRQQRPDVLVSHRAPSPTCPSCNTYPLGQTSLHSRRFAAASGTRSSPANSRYENEVSDDSNGKVAGVPLLLSHSSPEGARACPRRLGGRAKWLNNASISIFSRPRAFGCKEMGRTHRYSPS